MSSYRKILILLLALFFAAISCKKDNPTPETPIEEEKYETLPFSITIGITPMNGSAEGVELKQTFSDGDVVEISNSQVLYEPLNISVNGYEGKSQLVYSGELKVKKGAELVSGTTTLTAALKNGTNYNNGKPFIDVKKVSSFAEGLEKYSCWMCQDFTYNADAIIINLVQSTVYLNINLFGTKVSMKYGLAFYNEFVNGNCFFAVPSGATTEISDFNVELSLDATEKIFYRIGAIPPDNCLHALFSVGENKQVYFSRGNLQYYPKDGSWRLAPQQYHRCFSNSMIDVGENYANWQGEDNWTDLFQWGSFLVGGKPYLASKNTDTPPVDANGLMSGVCAFGAEWTILSADEWEYLITQRPNALEKSGGAVVNGVDGWVILPNDWETPEGVSPFQAQYTVKYTKDIPNQYTKDEWALMESAGAVFLPKTGTLIGSDYYNVLGNYQSLSFDVTTNESLGISFDNYVDEAIFNCKHALHYGDPVRLVQYKAETSDIQVE